MKNIILLLVVLLLVSCGKTPPSGQIWLLELVDGRVFEVTRISNNIGANDYSYYTISTGPQLAFWPTNIKSLKLVKVNDTSLGNYDEGYKRGQIDYSNNKICYIKSLNEDDEIIFIDTCKHK